MNWIEDMVNSQSQWDCYSNQFYVSMPDPSAQDFKMMNVEENTDVEMAVESSDDSNAVLNNLFELAMKPVECLPAENEQAVESIPTFDSPSSKSSGTESEDYTSGEEHPATISLPPLIKFASAVPAISARAGPKVSNKAMWYAYGFLMDPKKKPVPLPELRMEIEGKCRLDPVREMDAIEALDLLAGGFDISQHVPTLGAHLAGQVFLYKTKKPRKNLSIETFPAQYYLKRNNRGSEIKATYDYLKINEQLCVRYIYRWLLCDDGSIIQERCYYLVDELQPEGALDIFYVLHYRRDPAEEARWAAKSCSTSNKKRDDEDHPGDPKGGDGEEDGDGDGSSKGKPRKRTRTNPKPSTSSKATEASTSDGRSHSQTGHELGLADNFVRTVASSSNEIQPISPLLAPNPALVVTAVNNNSHCESDPMLLANVKNYFRQEHIAAHHVLKYLIDKYLKSDGNISDTKFIISTRTTSQLVEFVRWLMDQKEIEVLNLAVVRSQSSLMNQIMKLYESCKNFQNKRVLFVLADNTELKAESIGSLNALRNAIHAVENKLCGTRPLVIVLNHFSFQNQKDNYDCYFSNQWNYYDCDSFMGNGSIIFEDPVVADMLDRREMDKEDFATNHWQKVYAVYPIPQTMNHLPAEFNPLTEEEQESNWIRHYLEDPQLRLKTELKIASHARDIVLSALKRSTLFSQKFLRSKKINQNFASIRDMLRCVHFFKFLLQTDYSSVFLPDFSRDGLSKVEVQMSRCWQALLMSLSLTYSFRLPTELRGEYADLLKIELTVPPPDPQQEEMTEIDKLMKRFPLEELLQQSLNKLWDGTLKPPGIAGTKAIKENLYVSAICTEACVPLIITGPPGSGKSLSFQILCRNMKGPSSPKHLYQKLKNLHAFIYHCSKQSSAEAIKDVYETAENHSEIFANARTDTERCVVCLDEAGLTTENKHNEAILNSIHDYTNNAVVVSILLTNQRLDAAKSNRAVVLLQENEICLEDCLQLATKILLPDMKASDVLAENSSHPGAKMQILGLSEAFIDCKQFDNYHGLKNQRIHLRDFIFLCRSLRNRFENTSIEKESLLFDEILLVDVLRLVFNGILETNFHSLVHCFLQHCRIEASQTFYPRESSLILLNASLFYRFGGVKEWNQSHLTRIRVFREPPDFTDINYAAMIAEIMKSGESIILLYSTGFATSFFDSINKHSKNVARVSENTNHFLHLLLRLENIHNRVQLLKFNNFKDDPGAQEISMVGKVPLSCKERELIIFVDTEGISECFYDFFNQHFRRFAIFNESRKSKCLYLPKIADGSHSRRCAVTPLFQCVEHVTLPESRLMPAQVHCGSNHVLSAALLNRLLKTAIPSPKNIAMLGQTSPGKSTIPLLVDSALRSSHHQCSQQCTSTHIRELLESVASDADYQIIFLKQSRQSINELTEKMNKIVEHSLFSLVEATRLQSSFLGSTPQTRSRRTHPKLKKSCSKHRNRSSSSFYGNNNYDGDDEDESIEHNASSSIPRIGRNVTNDNTLSRRNHHLHSHGQMSSLIDVNSLSLGLEDLSLDTELLTKRKEEKDLDLDEKKNQTSSRR